MAGIIDRALIAAKAGNGGNGLVTFHSEKFLAKGGPSGGDGGRGADIVLVADQSLNTLISFRYRKEFKGDHGGPGGSSKKHGRNGENVLIKVPVGTQVFDIGKAEGNETQVADLVADGQSLVIARGGRGGLGNAHFVGATNQEPLLAEAGEIGEEKTLRLELKLLADVGIIGMPNAGKSSLIAAISAARPKVADYPFTTLEPVLGVVEFGRRALVAVDIPGLIQGAHLGAGLGHDFLRHVERTRVLVHLVDGSEADVAGRVETINAELEKFDPRLLERPQLLVVNKVDLPGVAARRSELKASLRRFMKPEDPTRPRESETPYFVSAATHEGIPALVPALFELLDRSTTSGQASSPRVEDDGDLPILRPRGIDAAGAVEVEGESLRIVHRRAVRIANGSDLTLWKARAQFREQLRRMGILRELERMGARAGTTVKVGVKEIVWD